MSGRPTKLTPEVSKEICESLASCMQRGDAARLAGVSHEALRDWVQKGEDGEEPFAAFLQEVVKAELLAQRRLLTKISLAASSDPRHAEWLLSRRWARSWGDKDRGEAPYRRAPRKTSRGGGNR